MLEADGVVVLPMQSEETKAEKKFQLSTCGGFAEHFI
jgi:hypothetical protein